MRRTRPRETVKDLLRADLRPVAAISYTGAVDNALACDVKNLEVVFTMTYPPTPCPPGSGKVQKKHGLWPEDIVRMRHEQQDRCYLCGGPLPLDGYLLAIDHDHRCCPYKRSCQYCRRGLACHSCNLLIGHAHDDPALLRRIADNLEAAIADVTRRLAFKPAQDDLYEPVELDVLAVPPQPRAKHPKVKAKAKQPPDESGPVRRDALDDVLAVFGKARGLHWTELADLLSARFPDRWGGVPKAAVSAQVRALGVPGVNIRRGDKVLWGCRRVDVETVVANRKFWPGWGQ